jgi:bleomycin hydrolase
MEINNKFLESVSREFNQDNKNKLAKNAVTSTKLENIIIDRDVAQNHNRIFSNVIDVKTLPSDQKRSGRCWLFALCNMLRLKMIKQYNLPPSFEMSTSYLFFYDKLEKSNFFLNMILKYKNEPENSRLNKFLLSNPLSDGGNWNMILNLVNKYGTIPKDCFNETFHTENTYNIDFFLSNKLRDYAYLLRQTKTSTEIQSILKKSLSEIYRILVIFIGEPPRKITWEYLDNGKYKIIKNIDPLYFYKKFVPVNLNEYVLLSHNPTQKDYINFTINNFNNMKDGVEIIYTNVTIDDIKIAIKKSLDDGDPLWFGCDVGKYLEKSFGVLDTDILDYKTVFNTDINLNKKNRLLYCTSDVTHAMLLRGYDNQTIQKKCDKANLSSRHSAEKSEKEKSPKGKSKSPKGKSKSPKDTLIKRISKKTQKGGATKTRSARKTKRINKNKCKHNKNISDKPIGKYLVENSWGKTEFDENIVMTDKYFDEYFYIVAVHKKYLPSKIIKITKQKPKQLQVWDPFGYLLF